MKKKKDWQQFIIFNISEAYFTPDQVSFQPSKNTPELDQVCSCSEDFWALTLLMHLNMRSNSSLPSPLSKHFIHVKLYTIIYLLLNCLWDYVRHKTRNKQEF